MVAAAFLLGAIAVFDLLVLIRRGEDAVAAARVAIPLAAAALAVQLVTGGLLFAADARALARNPAFLGKLALIGLALANLAALHVRFGSPRRGGFPAAEARTFAAVSLVAWTLAVAAGRMIAYV